MGGINATYSIRIWWKKEGEFGANVRTFLEEETALKEAQRLRKLGYGTGNSEIRIYKHYGNELIKEIYDTETI